MRIYTRTKNWIGMAAGVAVLSAIAALLPATAVAAPGSPLPEPCERDNPPAACFAGSPVGHLDQVTRTPDGVRVSGIATDPDAPGPVEISVEIGHQYAGSIKANGVAGEFAGAVYPYVGDQVCVWAINRKGGEDLLLGCPAFAVRTEPFGHIDEVTGGPSGRIRGWVIDPDIETAPWLDIRIEGQPTQHVPDVVGRPDVAAAYPAYGPDHGFDLSRPIVGHPRVCADAINVGPGFPLANVTIGCAVATQQPPAAPPGVETMSVATLNIIGKDSTALAGGFRWFSDRLDDLAVAAAGFDVVGLQEVDSAAQVAQLAQRAGYPYYTVATGKPDFPDLAFLSRVPLSDVRTYEGPKTGCVIFNCGGPVWILTATVEMHDKSIRLVTTHVSGDYQNEDGTGLDRSAWRAEQARFIKEQLVDPFPGRVLVVGDFNGNDDLVLPRGPLSDAAMQAAANVEIPGTGIHCGDRIDLILPRAPMHALFYDGVYGGTSCAPAGVSDHPRVSAVLALTSPPVTPPPPVQDPTPEPPDDRVCANKPWTPGC